VFQAGNIVTEKTFDAEGNSFEKKLGILATVARVQNYMIQTDVKEKLIQTGQNIEKTLTSFYLAASDHNNPHEINDAFDKFKENFPSENTLTSHHEQFLKAVVKKGSQKASSRIQALARHLNSSIGADVAMHDPKLVAQMYGLADGSLVPSGLTEF
jgi:hypothetical protein